MKIVIDIPKEHYEYIQNLPHYKTNYEQDLILDGTPLPKNYGKLIDADEALKEMQNWLDDCEKTSIYTRLGFETAIAVVEDAPTIIEAESEEEE